MVCFNFLKIISKFSNQKCPKMAKILEPPNTVYLMKKLNRQAFDKPIQVAVINISSRNISKVLPLIKKHILKIDNFKPVSHAGAIAQIFLNPEEIKVWEDIAEDVRTRLKNENLSTTAFEVKDFTLKYENYSAETLLKSVLPKDKEGVSSFTKIGHIVHVNLREHLIPYKDLIGEVLYDKVSGCKSVVNKTNMIDNTYRNFQMEVLKGEHDMITTVKENNCQFTFDFSKVYWNSRLCTEHERIVKVLQANDVLFDVFSGVGPFAVPAAKKKCTVFANDLNPESFKWLMHNKKLNKIPNANFTGYNLDGRDFLLEVVREKMPHFIRQNRNVFVTMNLPALAVEFLETFQGLLRSESDQLPESFAPVTVFVYCFAKGENPEMIAENLVVKNLNVNSSKEIFDIFRVRTVSSMKEMMRVTLKLDRDVLVGKCTAKRKTSCQDCLLDCKKSCGSASAHNGEEQEERQQCVQSGRGEEPKNEGQS